MKACLPRLISYLGKPGSLRRTLKAVSPSVYCVKLGTLFCIQLWHAMKEYRETKFCLDPIASTPTHSYPYLLKLRVTKVITMTYQTDVWLGNYLHGFFSFWKMEAFGLVGLTYSNEYPQTFISGILYIFYSHPMDFTPTNSRDFLVKYNWHWVASVWVFLSFSNPPTPSIPPQLSSRRKGRDK